VIVITNRSDASLWERADQEPPRWARADGDELMINLTTAKALGIEVPMGLMLRADELVE
jgi:hypothetical protein